MSRSVERILEEAHLSGDLKLNGQKLKEFPSTEKYDLTDTVFADLSRNRFFEVPGEVTKFWCLEHLNLYHNNIRSIPDSIAYLQSLVYLDLSHNQLSALPSSVCHLPLEILLVSNNKLQCLPTELGLCKTLTELDVSCNQLNRLPPQLGLLTLLRSLNIRCNMLLEIPLELTYLRLTRLDLSRNRIASLPMELKNMSSSLEILRLSDNPLMAPPAVICAKGMIHVFKWLELRFSKQENKKGSYQPDPKNGKRKFDLPKNQLGDNTSIDWSFLNSDPSIQLCSPADEKILYSRSPARRSSEPDSVDKSCNNNRLKSLSNRTSIMKSMGDVQSVSTNKLTNKSQSYENQPNEKGHLQTYREYKESLRLQRTVDSVYKCTQREGSNCSPKPALSAETIQTIPETKLLISENAAAKPPMPKEKEKKETPANSSSTEKLNSIMKPSVVRTKSRTGDIPFDKMQFTMRREYEKAKEEAELIRQLRTTIESRLKVVLPDDLSSALSDGVVLCHFANHILPHSVASIHVPSPTVPKLTTARSRRNVDNFLEACRKIGVEEELLCNRNDILEMNEDILPRLAAIVQNSLTKSDVHFLKPNEHFSQTPQVQNSHRPSTVSDHNNNKLSTILCLVMFFSINLFLYLFPIPY